MIRKRFRIMRQLLPFSTSRRTSPLWLVIFSDMSTNLMLFFLLLFAMTRLSESDRNKLVEGMEKAMVNKDAIEQRELLQYAEDRSMRSLDAALIHGSIKQYAKVEKDENKVKLTIEMPFFFDTGSAVINPKALVALQSLVPPVKDFPHPIIVEGHTDDVPISGGRYHSNWELSVARAVSVIDFFTNRGVNPKKMVAGGYGKYRPLHPNDSWEHRALNRRIEITLLKTKETFR
jgi:chemotaxis protein MotB